MCSHQFDMVPVPQLHIGADLPVEVWGRLGESPLSRSWRIWLSFHFRVNILLKVWQKFVKLYNNFTQHRTYILLRVDCE